MSTDIPFNPELTGQFQQFPSRRNFSILKFLEISRKKQQQPPGCSILQKNFSKICLKDKTKSHELLCMICLYVAEQQW